MKRFILILIFMRSALCAFEMENDTYTWTGEHDYRGGTVKITSPTANEHPVNLGYLMQDGSYVRKDSSPTWTGQHIFNNLVIISSNIVVNDIYLTEFSSGNESVSHILKDTLNDGILNHIDISDDGGLNVSWGIGEIYDHLNKLVRDTVADSGTCTDNVVNYLYWDVSGSTIVFTTTKYILEDIPIAEFYALDGDIWGMHEYSIVSHRESDISNALHDMFPAIVTNGLAVSEDTDVTYTWDIEMTAGQYYYDGYKPHTIASTYYTRTNGMVRWWHDDGGNWTYDFNVEISSRLYDTGAGTGTVTASKYYPSMFMVVGSSIHYILATTAYDTVAQAITGGAPPKPTALEQYPATMCVVLKGNATVLPDSDSDQWADIRPGIGNGVSGIISNHGNLAGLDDPADHSWALTTASATANFISTGVTKILAGANITISPTDGRGDVTITGAAGGGGGAAIEYIQVVRGYGAADIYNSSDTLKPYGTWWQAAGVSGDITGFDVFVASTTTDAFTVRIWLDGSNFESFAIAAGSTHTIISTTTTLSPTTIIGCDFEGVDPADPAGGVSIMATAE